MQEGPLPAYGGKKRFVTSSITGERIEIPPGWSADNFHERLIDLGEKDPSEMGTLECPECDSPMQFHQFQGTSQWTGDLQTTAYMIVRNIPVYRCRSCDLERAPMAAVEEIQQRAFATYKELNIHPWSEMKDFKDMI